ncbi:DsbA family protein [Methylobacterium nodulans]|uniref:Putative DsbA-like thioredoxin protein n=1 Tax=Methylobacterium nodulans (strain LMG 21967 / CNCM I-2342 / ORS 2060) TaxID=460265 RepID=B8IWJ5_METNO|nr:protein disulfide-isomerase [Methylobacterium nodulans]ACL62785.1 putative DsbA-like thioredoxin protein [Methylobacterium nodulans ORS 2060]
MSDLELRYYFDPLCGWCYASAEALAALAERHGSQLRMMPVGLFFEPRPVSAIADHAWRNDQRIGGLTGQPFSEAYHRNVLQAPDGVFTSGPLTLALAALGETDAALEPRFLHAAQRARYVEGRDTSQVAEVVPVAIAVATEAGLKLDPDGLGARLRNDAALAERVADRITAAQAEMHGLPGGGVPQLLVRVGGKAHAVSGQTLYAGRDAILAAVEQASLAS